MKTAEEAMAGGVDCCGPVKTSHKACCLAILEKLTEEFLGGPYLVMNTTPRVPGDGPIMDIGYKYNSRKVLGFIAEGAGSTEPGDPYLDRHPDNYLNVSVRPAVHPHFLGRHFNAYNATKTTIGYRSLTYRQRNIG